MADNTNTSTGDGNNQANDKVTFTPEQQARIDEIIREAQGRAAKETRTQLEAAQTQLTTLQSELAELKKQRPAKTTGTDAEALAAQIEEMKAASQSTRAELETLRQSLLAKDNEVKEANSRATNIQKQVAMQSAASKIGFVDLDAVMALTSGQVQFSQERGRFVVLNEKGQERLNAAYEPMTLEEYYTEFAANKPYLVRSDVKGGAGSTGSQRTDLSNNGRYTVEQIFGPKSDSRKASELMRTNPAEYRRMKVQAQEQGLID